jgi:hypothetical protein
LLAGNKICDQSKFLREVSASNYRSLTYAGVETEGMFHFCEFDSGPADLHLEIDAAEEL